MAKLTFTADKTPKHFDSSMLNTGQMMIVTDNSTSRGEIAVRLENGLLLCLNDMKCWSRDSVIPGVLLGKGDFITLTQE